MVLPNFLHLLNPPLALFVAVAPRLIDGVYKRFGAGGLLALPFVCLTLEKVTYDSFLAIRGSVRVCRVGVPCYVGMPGEI
jgi:hypothetical protein